MTTSMLARANEFIVQPRIDAAGGQKRVMSSTFDDATLVQHEDEIGFPYRAETMRYNKRCPAPQ